MDQKKPWAGMKRESHPQAPNSYWVVLKVGECEVSFCDRLIFTAMPDSGEKTIIFSNGVKLEGKLDSVEFYQVN